MRWATNEGSRAVLALRRLLSACGCLAQRSKLTRFDLPLRFRIGTYIGIYENASLSEVDLEPLSNVDALSIRDNAVLSRLELGGLETVDDLAVENNPALSITVFDGVKTFDSSLSGNADAPGIAAPDAGSRLSGFLGFVVDWEHRLASDLPLYRSLSTSDCRIHLTEHPGGSRAASIFHTPGRVSHSRSAPEEMLRFNVDGTLSFVWEATRSVHPVRRSRCAGEQVARFECDVRWPSTSGFAASARRAARHAAAQLPPAECHAFA